MALWLHVDGKTYEGETWVCPNCGYEITLREDHDLPATCPECGNGGCYEE